MEDIKLVQGYCPKCGFFLFRDKERYGPNPPLGTVCCECRDKAHPQCVDVFLPENIDFVAIEDGPDHFAFSGTQVLVNGKAGVVQTAYGNWASVLFEGDRMWTSIALGYWDLKRLYKWSLEVAV